MHFPIISLEGVDTTVGEWGTSLPYDDPTLLEYSDYAGDLYNKRDRSDVIHSRWLKDLFSGYAVIDDDKETIIFNDADTIRRTFREYLKDETRRLNGMAEDNDLSGYEFRSAGVRYNDCDAMFYDGCMVYTSFQFIEDAVYLAGKTFRFGNVFDAHF